MLASCLLPICCYGTCPSSGLLLLPMVCYQNFYKIIINFYLTNFDELVNVSFNVSYLRFFWQLCEEDRVKSLVEGLDKKSLVRGLNTSDVFSSSDKEEGKKVGQLIQNWKDTMGSNDTWARKETLFFNECRMPKIIGFII